jgi:FKBP-type peptidyl-prolyl cis-trans isomerase
MRFVSTALAATFCLMIASIAPRAHAAELQTEDQKTIYALGFAQGERLGPFALTPEEIEVLIAGMRDGAQEKPAAVAMDVYGPKINGLAQTRSTQVAAKEKEAGAAFLASEAAADGATKTPSGLIKRVVKEGSGASPAPTDTVKVHYHGTLRDGSVFDSSVERGTPAEFPLNRVIPCWTEAVQGMKVGEKAHITCPSEIAYGDRGMPPKIKGGAALAFDVELIEIVKPAAASTPPQPE